MDYIIILFSGLYVISAAAVTIVKSSFKSVLWYGIVGFFSSVLMLLIGAPDVALTQFTVGVVLIFLVYVMAIRKQRKVRLGFIETPYMIEKNAGGFEGLEWQIITRMEKLEGFEIEAIQYKNISEAIDDLKKRKLDILCGGITKEETKTTKDIEYLPYLETMIFTYKDQIIDYVHLKSLSKKKIEIEALPSHKTSYVFLFSEASLDIKEVMEENINDLKENGEVEKMVERYL
ncbi:MAG: hydrogenase subunit MbhD domain-containing protein [Kosmotogaceae bacterium]